ncbi:uncharacterized protein LOC134844959 [Symsagittifera roscoffensis]|uniref:uncharacterized protein LOC134844959 n=1 Tax=Symsagittifera roscoffensis TaxID=84072 RepID=UPI00307CB204
MKTSLQGLFLFAAWQQTFFVKSDAWNFSTIVPEGRQMCSDVQGGLAQLFRGVDISRLDLLPLDFFTDNGFRGQVLEMNCKLLKQKFDPRTDSYTQVPDIVHDLVLSSDDALEITSKVFDKVIEIKRAMADQVGISYENGMFSNSGSFRTAARHMVGDDSEAISNVEKPLFEQGFSKVIFYGGNLASIENNSVVDWIKNTSNDLFVFKGRLRPISDLIENDTKRQSMMKAVQMHIDRAFLSESETKVNILIEALKTNKQIAELTKLKKRTVDLRQKSFPNHDLVQSLSSDIDHELEIPAWFRATSICYKFYEVVKKGNMTEVTQSCAPVNQVTDVFEDWSGGRSPGGYEIAWGVFNNASIPTLDYNWFSQLQLCFKYIPAGDRAQCGDGFEKELCSSLNEFLPYYYDGTDSRSGGCVLSWKLTTPSMVGIPTWFLNAKICYFILTLNQERRDDVQFYKRCAVMNNYTPYLSDYTFKTFLSFTYSANFVQWSIQDATKSADSFGTTMSDGY